MFSTTPSRDLTKGVLKMVALNRALLLLGAVCLLCVSQLCSATEYDHRVCDVTFFHDLVSCAPLFHSFFITF